jgi:hypothetical protein
MDCGLLPLVERSAQMLSVDECHRKTPSISMCMVNQNGKVLTRRRIGLDSRTKRFCCIPREKLGSKMCNARVISIMIFAKQEWRKWSNYTKNRVVYLATLVPEKSWFPAFYWEAGSLLEADRKQRG